MSELSKELQTSDLVLDRIRARKAERFQDYQIKREMDFHVSEHETLLSFNSDWQSEAFQSWLNEEGMNHFAEWLKTNEQNYQ